MKITLKRAEANTKTPQKKIFSDRGWLLEALSLQRFEVLRYLRRYGPRVSRRAALDLFRDHEGLKKDLRQLQSIGLVEQTEEGMFFVPWDEIVIELPLADD